MWYDTYLDYAKRALVWLSIEPELLAERWRAGANRRSIIIISVGGFAALCAYVYVIAPPHDFPIAELVTIPEGTNAHDASKLLEDAHIIQRGALFELIVRVIGAERGIKAGDYLFKEPKDMLSIARAVTTGAYGLEPIRIRVPEGATTRDMAKLFAAQLQRFDAERFLKNARPDEGYFFPDTYFFLPNATDDTVIATMRQNFDAQIAAIAGEVTTFGKPLDDIVTMASILEKEGITYEDRRMIAGVLWRRIKIGMALQVDAAFLYSIGRSTFKLTNTDLKNSDDAYNTYAHKGLPPTPIASPSMSSLKAAVHPIDKGYLFYLADHNHVTHYSKTYEEHLRLKALYLGT